MLFVATFQHSADNCWAREEKSETAEEWIGSIGERAAEHGVELHGSYVTPSEHTIYFILEVDEFESVSRFLDSPFLEDHDGHIAPVHTFGEVSEILLGE
jgi:hypothetical protein